ncbi:XRE family transcriptional regulator [Xylanimonas protaetiae]|uniref:XRE family transcriptional regulator n=1 Tax=Xylanimonas protaetiae TaxID=2509457 RepID=A0A4P6FGL0_9MICO|nr:XRE family transcriptional regulator [Xylanimonas protaetiae]QAY69738.1 XRE family transcriptional regulator [Xylanimonas protaetiae]
MTPNERLRAAITDAGLTLAAFGEQVGVDPKTVERWITKDRIPHRTHRMKAAHILGKSDVFLWPATEADPRTRSATRAEFVEMLPSRASVPVSTWESLIDNATEAIDLLAFAGSFLHDSIPEFAERLAVRARAGVRVRLLFGDPDSAAVALRGEEEGIGELMAARCRLTWNYLAPLMTGVPGIEARKHGSTLYASLFRFDDALLVNPHALGAPAGHSPILHINRIPGGRLFAHYMESFEQTWQAASAR